MGKSKRTKFYGVYSPTVDDGHVFNNWGDCEMFVQRMKGCGYLYKSFFDIEEANQFSRGEEVGKAQKEADAVEVDGIIKIYTDGATAHNGSADKSKIRAGVGVFFPSRPAWNVSEPFLLENPTNQRAEIFAIVRAMEVLDAYQVPLDAQIELYTDSNYCVQAYKSWIPKWRLTKCNWTTASGAPVKNRTLLELMYEKCKKRKITMYHINGHVGIPGNEAADRLAVAGCV